MAMGATTNCSRAARTRTRPATVRTWALTSTRLTWLPPEFSSRHYLLAPACAAVHPKGCGAFAWYDFRKVANSRQLNAYQSLFRLHSVPCRHLTRHVLFRRAPRGVVMTLLRSIKAGLLLVVAAAA